MLGHMLVLLDRLSVRSVLLGLPHHLVHRRAMSAHHVKKGTTTLQADLRARSAWPEHTVIVFHRQSAKNVRVGLVRYRLVQITASDALLERSPLQMGLCAKIARPGHIPI